MDTDRYNDIIDLPHHRSKTHEPMPLINRAAQFAPFAALTGHDAAIRETSRTTETQADLSAEKLNELSAKLTYALSFADRPPITITYFKPDPRKDGGFYHTVTKAVKKVDEIFNQLILTDDTAIPLDKISDITGAIFDDLEA